MYLFIYKGSLHYVQKKKKIKRIRKNCIIITYGYKEKKLRNVMPGNSRNWSNSFYSMDRAK